MATNTFFSRKKAKILEELNQSNYTDKSPKGSVDAEIVDLIEEINAFDGYVTTSSCAGRVAVFVEGHKAGLPSKDETNGATEVYVDVGGSDKVMNGSGGDNVKGAGPGGKGFGNKWLYVSHSPVPPLSDGKRYHNLFELGEGRGASLTGRNQEAEEVRLVKLSFSPLILHILCASLQAAKPLLAAAINSGFRESGVQSLKALDDSDAGVMLAIRTAGLSFDTVIGMAETVAGGQTGTVEEVYKGLVDENYLRLCMKVINERFEWNVDRRERLRKEILQIKQNLEKNAAWEDSETRKKRKKQEGQLKAKSKSDKDDSQEQQEDDVLENGLFLDTT